MLRRFLNRKTVYTPIESRDLNAVARAHDEALIAEQDRAYNAANNPDGTESKRSLRFFDKAVQAYLKDCERQKVYEAHRDAKHVLGEFKEVTHVVYTKDVNQESIRQYQDWLRTHGRAQNQTRIKNVQGTGSSERTVKNKTLRVLAFLNFTGADTKQLFDKRKYMPKPEKKLPKIYNAAQIDTLMTAVEGDDSLRMGVLLGLKLGLRELEIAHAMWGNIDWVSSVYHVKSAPAFDWKIKDKEERTVPIPADLLAELKVWREQNPGRKLIVGTASDKPNYHFLRAIKRAIRSSGFNCGECKGCTGKTRECSVYDLHTLRRTYITKLLRSGFDIATIQEWVGHSGLESTSRYLKGEEAHTNTMQDKLSAIKWGSE